MKRVDVLLLGWPRSERDFHITLPILFYLKKRYNLNVKYKNIFNGYYYINKYRPEILLISNYSGASTNHKIVKYAYLRGIKVVSLMSEGNIISESTLDCYLWGHNKEKKLYVDLLLTWSERARNIILKKYPEYENIVKTSGATGFDRLINFKFLGKEYFLKENSFTKYKKVVCIATSGLDLYVDKKYFESQKDIIYSRVSKEQISRHRRDLYEIQDIYASLVKNNRDILFILRYHPGTVNFNLSEFSKIGKEDNVYISKECSDIKYTFSELLNISDLWITYQSTSVLEAWLLKKTTILVNPSGSDFIREEGYRGSPICKDFPSLNKLVHQYYQTGELKEFVEKKKYREKAIKNVIGWDDGENHIRAGDIIYGLYISNSARSSTISPYINKKEYLGYLISKTKASRFSRRIKRLKDRDISHLTEIYQKMVEDKIRSNNKII